MNLWIRCSGFGVLRGFRGTRLMMLDIKHCLHTVDTAVTWSRIAISFMDSAA